MSLAQFSLDDDGLKALRHDMLRFAALQLRDDQLAEDMVQEAMIAALGNAQSYAGRATLKTWVFGILRHKIVDAIRSHNRTVNLSALAPEDAELDQAFDALFGRGDHWRPEGRPCDWGDPEEALHQQQFWAVFDACLEHLPENTARVFMMREFLEFDTAEICAELKITTSNCHVILHRARNGLRRCLEKTWFAPGAQPC